MHVIIKSRSYLLTLIGTLLVIVLCGCESKVEEDTVSDKTLSVFQIKLLDIAFKTASAIPINPHIKDRSKAQEDVIETCLELGQPKRALTYIEKIENWRRGLCYANLAFYCAKQNYNKEANKYLKIAEEISKDDHGQEWRNNQIKAIIAKTRTELGQIRQANKIKNDLANSETDKLAQAEAKISPEETFDEHIAVLDGLIETGDYSMITSALKAYTRLYNKFYQDEKQRLLAEDKIKTSWEKVPVFIRIGLLLDLAGFSLEYSDQNKALELVNQAQILMDDSQWRLEHKIGLVAKISELRHKADDVGRAKIDADAVLVLFNDQKSEIVDIYRAQTLQLLGQAYQYMGDTKTALAVYKLAIEESVINPNSRPRAKDLSAICCSMALHAVEPDSELWMRINRISEELGHPW